jgi:hypothetical protein
MFASNAHIWKTGIKRKLIDILTNPKESFAGLLIRRFVVVECQVVEEIGNSKEFEPELGKPNAKGVQKVPIGCNN